MLLEFVAYKQINGNFQCQLQPLEVYLTPVTPNNTFDILLHSFLEHFPWHWAVGLTKKYAFVLLFSHVHVLIVPIGRQNAL